MSMPSFIRKNRDVDEKILCQYVDPVLAAILKFHYYKKTTRQMLIKTDKVRRRKKRRLELTVTTDYHKKEKISGYT